MKKKTYIKQSAFQKVENTRGTDIKGALNLNKEVLDTLVDKTLAGTVDCCLYFPVISEVEVPDPSSVSLEDIPQVPNGGLFYTMDGGGNLLLWIKTPESTYSFTPN